MPKKIYLHDIGDVTLKQAVNLMTDKWICAGNVSDQTVMDIRDALKAAQQSVQRTAIAAGALGLLAGVVIGYILGVR